MLEKLFSELCSCSLLSSSCSLFISLFISWLSMLCWNGVFKSISFFIGAVFNTIAIDGAGVDVELVVDVVVVISGAFNVVIWIAIGVDDIIGTVDVETINGIVVVDSINFSNSILGSAVDVEL